MPSGRRREGEMELSLPTDRSYEIEAFHVCRFTTARCLLPGAFQKKIPPLSKRDLLYEVNCMPFSGRRFSLKLLNIVFLLYFFCETDFLKLFFLDYNIPNFIHLQNNFKTSIYLSPFLKVFFIILLNHLKYFYIF